MTLHTRNTSENHLPFKLRDLFSVVFLSKRDGKRSAHDATLKQICDDQSMMNLKKRLGQI